MNRKLVAITGALMLSLGACALASYNLSNDSRVVFVDGIAEELLSMCKVSGGDN